ncbi:hypothetical protein [Lentzea cavernae]|uniref:Uncharacterized protein n=1 Tax=Lentzea cavernae TaxID=2020703 RepID=A0ABQ3MTC1_9PSEU|nr:hypothetical protein [Lentzea cavernae]GHH57826.1 hypothetical protein GCM10017774_78180 [Lentzea cavernae]
MTALVHIVGTVTYVGQRTRQCCAWCGTVLLDYYLDRIAVPLGQDATAPAAFQPGALLEIDGNRKAVLSIGDEALLPDNACALTNLTAATEQQALDIADRVAAEEPTAGAGRATRRLLAALLDRGLIAQRINRPADLALVLEQLGFSLEGRGIANLRTSISDSYEAFNADKIRFRIEGDLVPVEGETASAPPSFRELREARALTEPVLPDELLDRLDKAWAQRKRWHVLVPVDGEISLTHPELLDRAERELAFKVEDLLQRDGRAVLTSTGPQWTVRAYSAGEPPEQKDKHERLFPRESPSTAQLGADVAGLYRLVCRMSGWSIPTIEEKTP